MGTDFSGPQGAGFAAALAGASAVMDLFQFAAYVLQAWGLYMMAQALKVERPWLAWIPVVQLHTLIRVSGKSWKWFLGWLAAVVALYGCLLAAPFLAAATGSSAFLALAAVGGIGGLVAVIVLAFGMYDGTAKRLGRGLGAAFLLVFLPFIFFPVYGKAALKKARASAAEPSVAA